MLLSKPEVSLDSLGESQHFLLLEGQSHHLDADWKPLCIFQVVSDEFGHGIVPTAFVVEFGVFGDCDGKRARSHPEDVENVGVGGEERAVFGRTVVGGFAGKAREDYEV